MILPSDCSKYVFPDNAPTHFTIQLPQNFCLHGGWCVGLYEIQIPLTFQHISLSDEEGTVCVTTSKRNQQVSINDLRFENDREHSFQIKPGVYSDIPSLLRELNNLNGVKNHLTFELQCGGYVQAKCVCIEDCSNYAHKFTFSKKLHRILGFSDFNQIICDSKNEKLITGSRPANLANGLPRVLMIYSSICRPYVTGDTQTQLLRAIPLHLHSYIYGSTEIMKYSSPMYLPLLSSSFQTIEVDIRDENGNPVSFDFGTLTVTLHFKRED